MDQGKAPMCTNDEWRQATRSSPDTHTPASNCVASSRVDRGDSGCPKALGDWSKGPWLWRRARCGAVERRTAEGHGSGCRARAKAVGSYLRGVLSVLVLTLAWRAPSVSAKVYSEPYLLSLDNWVFLDKFVFDTSGKGKVKWQLQVLPP